MIVNCKHIRPLLSAYLDSELDAAQQAEVAAHLDACPECARVLEAYRALGQDIRALPTAPLPTGMQYEFGIRLRRVNASPLSWMLRPNLRRGLTAAAFVVALVGLALGVRALLQHQTYPPDHDVASLVTSYPADGTSDVPLDATLTLTFARPMDRASVEDATSITPPTRLAFTWEGETLTVVPFDDWRPATTYTLTVASTARYADGAPLSEPIVLHFATAEEVPAGVLNPIGRFGVIWRAELGGPGGSLGYAIDVAQELWSATQPFERGRMIWVDQLEEDCVYVLMYGDDESSGTWQQYVDTFREGDHESAGFTPAEGMLEPIRGFGKVWREQLGGKEAPIGWALAPEQGYVGEVQPFEHGLMLWNPLDGVTYALLDDGTWTSYATPQ